MATDFHKDAFAKALRDQALPPFGKGLCATYVRKALESAGMATTGRPENAQDYGPFLIKHGFANLGASRAGGLVPEKYKAAVGDIVVIQGTSKSRPGHIAGWDGKSWISDFIQPSDLHPIYPGPSYRAEKPAYVIYRR